MTNYSAEKFEAQNASAEREIRERRSIPIDIERENGSGMSAVVTNLSQHGMGGHTDGYLQPFELITIIKKGYGRVVAEVRWIEGKNFGVLFAQPMNVDQFNFTDDNKQQHFI